MAKVEKYILEMWEQEQAFNSNYDYYIKFKEKPLGLLINGPDLSQYDNEPNNVNKAAVEQNVTWQELLGWEKEWKIYKKNEKDKNMLI